MSKAGRCDDRPVQERFADMAAEPIVAGHRRDSFDLGSARLDVVWPRKPSTQFGGGQKAIPKILEICA
jgi:hypothetical protein